MPSFAAFRSNFPNPSGRFPANLRVSSGVGGFATLDGCCAFVRAILEEKYLHVGHGSLVPGRTFLGHCCEKARDAKDLASMMSRLSSHKHELAPIANVNSIEIRTTKTDLFKQSNAWGSGRQCPAPLFLLRAVLRCTPRQKNVPGPAAGEALPTTSTSNVSGRPLCASQTTLTNTLRLIALFLCF